MISHTTREKQRRVACRNSCLRRIGTALVTWYRVELKVLPGKSKHMEDRLCPNARKKLIKRHARSITPRRSNKIQQEETAGSMQALLLRNYARQMTICGSIKLVREKFERHIRPCRRYYWMEEVGVKWVLRVEDVGSGGVEYLVDFGPVAIGAERRHAGQ